MPGGRRAAASLLGLGAWIASSCASGPHLESEELKLIGARPAGGASVTALALSADASRLAIGDHRGHVEVVEIPSLAAAIDDPTVNMAAPHGDVIAYGARGSEFLYVMRDGTLVQRADDRSSGASSTPFERPSGALFTPNGDVLAWSRLRRRLSFHPLAATRQDVKDPSDVTIDDVDVMAAAVTLDRAVVAIGRSAPATRLECRELPKFDVTWSVELGHAASGIAIDAPARLVVVACDGAIEIRALADGALLRSLPAAASIPCTLNDGRRMLLVQGETLSFLRLSDPPRIEPAFTGPASVVHRGGIAAVAVAANGTMLATGGARGDLCLFSIRPASSSRIPLQ